jgi:predicted TIM-barrel fold metal-dependent hydrolase
VFAALALSLVAALADTSHAQDTAPHAAPLDGREGRPLALENFRPEPQLQVEEHLLTAAKFPCVDVHVHPRIRLLHDPDRLDEFVRIMDAQNIAVCVSLDGGVGEALDEHLQYLWDKYRDRFVIFANVDWRGDGREDNPATWDCHRPDFPHRMARALEDAQSKGASGLKVFKDLGLRYRNPDGSLIAVDDPRWDEIWEACGRLGMPVLIHTADPAAFFEPIDERNERWEELHRHPEWSFFGPGFPTKEDLLAARNRVIERHPNTTFIAAHMANDAEDLAQLGEWLDRYPNFYVDLAARIAELGRQPYTARRFFLKYADRILFGTDGPRVAERLHYHWRLLETYDEYFPYAENPFPPQGFWRINGLGLPDDVLRQVYHENACRLVPGVRERWETFAAGRNGAGD